MILKKFLIAAAITVGLVAGPMAGVAVPTQDVDLHCPDGGVKVEAKDDNDSEADDTVVLNALVLDAGTRVCVKAGPGNTGIVIADGVDDLQQILFDNGIKNGNETDGKDVSYYVVYPPLLEAFICLDGEIVVLSHTVQASLNLLVSVFLELNDGAVQVLSRDAECEEEEPPTTTTTAPPVTTTTQPPVTAPKLPTCPELLPRVNIPSTDPVFHAGLDGDNDGVGCESAPVATPAPRSAPAPVNELPRTGVDWAVLALIGAGLGAAGLTLSFFGRRRNEA